MLRNSVAAVLLTVMISTVGAMNGDKGLSNCLELSQKTLKKLIKFGLTEEQINNGTFMTLKEIESPSSVRLMRFDQAHDLMIVGTGKGLIDVSLYHLEHKKVIKDIVKLNLIPEGEVAQVGVTSITVCNETKQIAVACEHKLYKIDLKKYIDFPEEEQKKENINDFEPGFYKRLQVSNDVDFVAAIGNTKYAVLSFSRGDILFDKCLKYFPLISSNLDNFFLTSLDVLELPNKRYLVAFASTIGTVDIVMCHAGDNQAGILQTGKRICVYVINKDKQEMIFEVRFSSDKRSLAVASASGNKIVTLPQEMFPFLWDN